MKTLPQIRATGEQLPLVSQNRVGVEVICGAAGSGKTSTALLRLRSLCYMFVEQRNREENPQPVKILVLTFNRTLAGYIGSLAQHQIDAGLNVDLQIDTFSHWAMSSLGWPTVQNDEEARQKIRDLATSLRAVSPDYLVKEVDYVLGRFEPEQIEQYISLERTGRGALPRVDRALRRRILDEVITPYKQWLEIQRATDWNGLAVSMTRNISSLEYDVIVVDESQDFSANQLRAVRHHLAPNHTVTFVIDTVQRIYARGFTWAEVGFDVRPERYHMLRTNHRNTAEIAAFAAGILTGINVEGDGALPNLNAASSHGSLPLVIKGLYSEQAAWAIRYINDHVDLATDSVAFLKPKGKGWFKDLRHYLSSSGIEYVEITRESEWPEGTENVALSTFHSAKGLEFDYVFLLGINGRNTQYDSEELDDQGLVLKRLLAVAIARARKAVIIGYKPGEESRLIQCFVPGTFAEIDL